MNLQEISITDTEVFLRFDLGDRHDILTDRNYFICIPRWSLFSRVFRKILPNFGGGRKARVFCIFRDNWKNLRGRFGVLKTLLVPIHIILSDSRIMINCINQTQPSIFPWYVNSRLQHLISYAAMKRSIYQPALLHVQVLPPILLRHLRQRRPWEVLNPWQGHLQVV